MLWKLHFFMKVNVNNTQRQLLLNFCSMQIDQAKLASYWADTNLVITSCVQYLNKFIWYHIKVSNSTQNWTLQTFKYWIHLLIHVLIKLCHQLAIQLKKKGGHTSDVVLPSLYESAQPWLSWQLPWIRVVDFVFMMLGRRNRGGFAWPLS